ncbi:hypothetical protein EZS27_020898 [termite gut metagenome]|uniref:DUF3127 domain-containing protein n=1 Tax=termite gut metagenome TaxID=433724 RepID=A0A5J4R8H5_9ZZZZ
MDLTGKIIAILQPKGGISKSSGNEWKAQEYVIETNEQYPKKMCFEVFGAEKIQQFNIQQGEELTVSFDIDARPWQDRWFNSIRAWKVERITTANTSPIAPPPNAPASTTATTVPELVQENADDDLPF